jgi:hypothetical protein
MNRILWIVLGIVFIVFFMLWIERQGGGRSCMQCFSMVFPEESQDVETPFVDEVNKESCLVNK